MKKLDGGPAFPVTFDFHTFEPKTVQEAKQLMSGMSLRDHFAGLAMQGMLACTRGYRDAEDVRGQETSASRAAFAYEIADAMIKARGAE